MRNKKFELGKSFEQLKNRLNIWLGEGSGWIVGKVENVWIELCKYEPLAGSSYIPLPNPLNNSMKGLINLKSKDLKCFMWCHIRFINPKNKHAERISKKDKKMAFTLDYRGINFAMKELDYKLIEERFQINVNIFGYENRVNPLYASKGLILKFQMYY